MAVQQFRGARARDRVSSVALRLQEGWAARSVAERVALGGLLGLMALGSAWRLWILLAVKPAFLGYSDVAGYVGSARAISSGHWFNLWLQPDGYPAFLAALHAISPHLRLVAVVQHGLGLLSGFLLYAAVRRAGGPPWLGLFPAAVVFVGGEHVLIEHTILSESLFIALVCGGIYAGVRAAGTRSIGWPALAAACLGLATTVRPAGLLLGPIFVVWLLCQLRRPSWRRTLLRAGVAALAVLVTAGGYAFAHEQVTGYFGFAPGTQRNLYGRVAPFADCRNFTPPPGTRSLCDPTPPAQRVKKVDEYVFNGGVSPGARLQGPKADALVGHFARTVVLHQPLAYASAILRDAWRYVDPQSPGSGNSEDWDITWIELIYSADPGHNIYSGGPAGTATRTSDFRPYYPNAGVAYAEGAVSAMRSLERVTRPQGGFMLVAIILMLAAPFLVPRPVRRATSWLTLAALVLMLSPLAGFAWNARLVLPAIAPIVAAAVLGAWGLATRLAHRRPTVPAGASRGSLPRGA